MVHKLTLTKPSDVLPNDPNPYGIEVWLGDRIYGVLRNNGTTYFGSVPSPDGKLVEGAFSLREWKQIISSINRDAAELEELSKGDPRMRSLQIKVDEAKARQRDFFDYVGILPGDVAQMSGSAREQLLAQYGTWLEHQGLLPKL